MAPCYKCEHCVYETSKFSNYTRHLRTHQIANQKFQCQYCAQEFASQYNLQRHVDNVSCKEYREYLLNYRQNVAGSVEKVSSNSVIRQEVSCDQGQEVSSDTGMHSCPTCYKTFTTERRLNTHVCKKTQHPLQCPRCLFIFAHKSSKSRHMQTCNASPQSPSPSQTKASSNTTITNIGQSYTINNNQNNYNLYINFKETKPLNFGQQTVDHVSHDEIRQCLHRLDGVGIADLAKAIFLNPNAPHNHNVKLITTKKLNFNVYENDKWEKRNGDKVIHDMLAFVCSKAHFWYYSEAFADLRGMDEDSKSIYGQIFQVKNKVQGTYNKCKKNVIDIFEHARNEEAKREREIIKKNLLLIKGEA